LVNGATVVCTDIDDVEIFSEATDATGMITEQEVIEEQYVGQGTIYTGAGGGTDIRTPHILTATYGTKTGFVEVNICNSYGEDSPLAITVSPAKKNALYDSIIYDTVIH